MSWAIPLVIVGAFIYTGLATYIDIMLYKNRKTRYLVLRKVKCKDDYELTKEYMQTNFIEVMLFVMGFFVALSFGWFGWL